MQVRVYLSYSISEDSEWSTKFVAFHCSLQFLFFLLILIVADIVVCHIVHGEERWFVDGLLVVVDS